jgi:hypothetical protein
MMAQLNIGPSGLVGSSSSSIWDQTTLLSALSSAGISTQPPPSASDWYMDTGTSSHMSNTPGNFPNSSPIPFQTSITVGNGAQLPITHSAATAIPTSSSPLRLNDIIISPSIVKNLVSIHQLTCDNNVSIEFDSHGFPFKALPTCNEIL